MIYTNKKTGAVIDSPCVISGKNWVKGEIKKAKGEDEIQEPDQETKEEEKEEVAKKKGR